ncbi:MAG: right-handed parallel beta-helix repeat-containing protein [Candidatus Eisenbacteria sp.]|nr:right-handed parallel beta-helix repeat-containing protein [Candidatus Eisenbacteria bacterium]
MKCTRIPSVRAFFGVVAAVLLLWGGVAEASWFTYPVSALYASSDFDTVCFGLATLDGRTDNGTSVDFEFSGVTSGGSGVKDDYAVLTVYGQTGASDFSGFTGAAILVENLDDETVKMHLFMNTGFTGPAGVPASCLQNDTFWGGPWFPIQPGETVLLTLDFGNAQAWNLSDNPSPHTCGVSPTCGVGNSCINGNQYAINAYDQTEVSGIGFEVLKESGDGDALVRLIPCLAPPDAYVDGSWTGTSVGDQVWFAGHPATMGYDAFDTIQDGIAGVSGSTVNVAAGTYNEQVRFSKGATVVGTGTVLIDPSGAQFEGPKAGADWVRSAVTFEAGSSGATLDNVTIQNSNASDLNGNAGIEVIDGSIDNVTIQNVTVSGVSGHGFGSYDTDHTWPPPSGWLIDHCQFSTSATGTWSGMRPQNMDDLTIQYCDIGPTNYGGILLINTSTSVVVQYNTVHNTVRAGIQVDSYCTETADILYNEVYATNSASAVDYGDVRLYGQYLPDPHGGAPATVTIQRNVLRDGYNGVCVKNGQDISTRTVTVKWNSITNHTSYGGYNGGTGTLNASVNWWGAASGPVHTGNPSGTGDAVSDYVDYDPWIGKSGGENIICVPDPQEISLADLVGSNYEDDVVVRYLGGGSGAVYGYSIEVEWNGTVISAAAGNFQRPASGPFSTASLFQVIPMASNKVRIDCAIGGADPGTLGPDDLFQCTFTAVGTPDYATSDVDITILAVRDNNNQALTGFYEDDGEVIVDLVGPSVTGVVITNTTLAHTNDYIKDTDNAHVYANVTDGGPGVTVTANLNSLGGGAAVPPGTFAGSDADWDYTVNTGSAVESNVNVTVTATDGLGNSSSASDVDGIMLDNIAPAAITGFDAEPHHQRVALSWDNPSGLDTYYYGVVVRFDSSSVYPVYGSHGIYPADESGGDGDAYNNTGAVTGGDHTVSNPRSIYYYTAFAYDWAMNHGPADGDAQDRATNYWLGDVTGSWTPGSEDYDGSVDAGDVSVLSGVYWTSGLSWSATECDVGPTDDGSRLGIPTVDDQIQFEDMMIFAMNFNVVTPTGMPPVVQLAGRPEAGPPVLRLESSEMAKGMTVSLCLGGNTAEVKAASMVLTYDPEILEMVSVTPTLADQVLFEYREAQPGEIWIDLAAMGTDVAIRGSGEVAQLTFQVKSDGDLDIRFSEVDLRGISNDRLAGSAEGLAFNLRGATPAETRLVGAWPNPFNPSTTIRYDIRHPEHVTIQVYNAQGRLVRTLLDDTLQPGRHSTVWNGRDGQGVEVSSGTYFVRMHTSRYESTRKVVMLK